MVGETAIPQKYSFVEEDPNNMKYELCCRNCWPRQGVGDD